MAGIVLAIAGYATFRFRAGAVVPPLERRPDQNVLLVTIDTLRADAVGVYGGRARTPNMDRLAALGYRFDFAHAHAVVTLPSHASLLTGLYPTQHGIHDNSGYRLQPSVPTLASRLKARGFATGAFVGAFSVDSRFGLTTGFDVYDDHYPGTSGGRDFILPERRADAVVSLAGSWLRGQRGPWFTWVHLFDPHAPYKPPEPFGREYASAPYYGEAAYADSVLADLFSAAAAASGGRPTVVIVTSDHGEGLGDHGEQTHGVFAYEATLRVPLILAQLPGGVTALGTATQPAGAAAGSVVTAPAGLIDLVPTVLDLLGMPADPALPGRSLVAATAGRQDPVPRASYFEALSPSLNRGWAPLRGVLQGREKYIDLPIAELYDLAADPVEQTNLADGRPERLRVLDTVLRAIPSGASASVRQADDAEAAERLRALGYVTGTAAPKARYTDADDPKRLIALDQEIHRAIGLYQTGRGAEAVPIYQRMISAHPGMEIAYTHLAMLQWELGSPDEAIATLRAAIAAGARSVAILTKLGTYLAERGHGAEAVGILREAVAGDSPDLDALNALGIALAGTGRFDEAEASFRRILEASPAHAMALENLGSIALQQKRYEDARGFFTQALATDPSSAQAHNGMGVVELRTGNRRAAIDHWRRAVAIDPSNFYALYNVAMELLADGQRDAARPYLVQFARTAPPALYGADIRRVQAILAGW